MDNDIDIDFDMCRGCGSKYASKSLSTYKDAFELCTGIAVSTSDGLPKKICDVCLKRLNISYYFKISCLRTERKIRAMKKGVMDTFRQCEGGYAADHVKEIVEEATIEEHLSESDEEQELYEEFVVYDETLYLDNLVTEENPAYAASNNSEDILTIDFVKPSSERSASPTVTSHTIRKKGPKPSIKFHCVECRKEFSTKTNLQRHQATHNGNKPFQCDICSKGFTQSGSLKTHRFTHLNIKPHACSVCNERFTQKKSLTFHMRRHTGEKPFSCDICMASFRQKSGLVRHKQQISHTRLTS
uniref:Protein krueppel n=1 Tax=Anopheles atroparvus TaxID=41427 RepID=A0AAG5DYW1_ANOAO